MNGGEPRMPQDEDVRQAWRAASDESPPSHVDAAILAAARDAARRPAHADGAPRVRSWYREWQPMLAAAAIAGLAFALVQTMPRDARVAMPPRASAPAAAQAESSELATAPDREAPVDTVEQPARQDASPAPPVQAAARAPAQAPVAAESDAGSVTVDARAEARNEAKSAAGVEQPVAAPAPAAATASAPEPGFAGSLMSVPPAAVAKRERSSAAVESKEVGAGLQVGAVKATVDARIEHIVALYQSGDTSGAATELRALRADEQGVDARLPPNLQAWARTVQ